MTFLRSLALAFSLFSRMPMPEVAWTERNRRYLMAAFPAVGVVIGAYVFAWWQLASALSLQRPLVATGLTLIPIALTGGIHLDGLADVVDARASHAESARKLEIMKDPHIGAFAIIAICGYLMLYAALCCELEAGQLALVACMPVASRCMAGLLTVSAQKAKKDGMLVAEGTTERQGVVRVLLVCSLCIVGMAMFLSRGALGLATLLVGIATQLLALRMARREFGGMTGDLAGYALQMSEIAMLATIALAGKAI